MCVMGVALGLRPGRRCLLRVLAVPRFALLMPLSTFPVQAEGEEAR